MAEDEDITENAIYQDWGRHAFWEPLIWAMTDCKNDPETILRGFELAKEASLKLMGSASQDSVKVAAVGRYVETLRLEIELRQSLGLLTKIPDKLDVKVNGVSDLLKQYESLFEEATLLEHCAPQPLHTQTTPPKNR
jgi:hypothetical protein